MIKFTFLDSDTEVVGNYVLGYVGNTLYLLNGINITPKVIESSTMTILNVKGDSVIYYDTSSSALKVIENIKNMNPVKYSLELNGKTIKTSSTTLFDFDGRNIYMFAGYTSEQTNTANEYLNRIDLNINYPEARFVGKFLEDHIPAQPDNQDLPEDEWEQWII